MMPRLVGAEKTERDAKLLRELLRSPKLTEAERVIFEGYQTLLNASGGVLTSQQRKRVVAKHFDLELGDSQVENLVSQGLIVNDEPIEDSLNRMYRHIPARFRHPLAPPGGQRRNPARRPGE
jgi:hypothetical protein